jgi:hypothetical protein
MAARLGTSAADAASLDGPAGLACSNFQRRAPALVVNILRARQLEAATGAQSVVTLDVPAKRRPAAAAQGPASSLLQGLTRPGPTSLDPLQVLRFPSVSVGAAAPLDFMGLGSKVGLALGGPVGGSVDAGTDEGGSGTWSVKASGLRTYVKNAITLARIGEDELTARLAEETNQAYL